MRFHCALCQEEMDESLVDQKQLKYCKSVKGQFYTIPCPFCHMFGLEVVA